MLTVIIPGAKDAEALADTLENLVRHAIDGFIQEVVLWHDGLGEAEHWLADQAGLTIRRQDEADLARVCAEARGNFLLFIESGARLQDGWAGALSRHAEHGGGPANFRIRFDDDRPWWKRLLAPKTVKSPLAAGFAISKSQALANLEGKANAEALMRGLAVKQVNAVILPPQP